MIYPFYSILHSDSIHRWWLIHSFHSLFIPFDIRLISIHSTFWWYNFVHLFILLMRPTFYIPVIPIYSIVDHCCYSFVVFIVVHWWWLFWWKKILHSILMMETVTFISFIWCFLMFDTGVPTDIRVWYLLFWKWYIVPLPVPATTSCSFIHLFYSGSDHCSHSIVFLVFVTFLHSMIPDVRWLFIPILGILYHIVRWYDGYSDTFIRYWHFIYHSTTFILHCCSLHSTFHVPFLISPMTGNSTVFWWPHHFILFPTFIPTIPCILPGDTCLIRYRWSTIPTHLIVCSVPMHSSVRYNSVPFLIPLHWCLHSVFWYTNFHSDAIPFPSWCWCDHSTAFCCSVHCSFHLFCSSFSPPFTPPVVYRTLPFLPTVRCSFFPTITDTIPILPFHSHFRLLFVHSFLIHFVIPPLFHCSFSFDAFHSFYVHLHYDFGIRWSIRSVLLPLPTVCSYRSFPGVTLPFDLPFCSTCSSPFAITGLLFYDAFYYHHYTIPTLPVTSTTPVVPHRVFHWFCSTIPYHLPLFIFICSHRAVFPFHLLFYSTCRWPIHFIRDTTTQLLWFYLVVFGIHFILHSGAFPNFTRSSLFLILFYYIYIHFLFILHSHHSFIYDTFFGILPIHDTFVDPDKRLHFDAFTFTITYCSPASSHWRLHPHRCVHPTDTFDGICWHLPTIPIAFIPHRVDTYDTILWWFCCSLTMIHSTGDSYLFHSFLRYDTDHSTFVRWFVRYILHSFHDVIHPDVDDDDWCSTFPSIPFPFYRWSLPTTIRKDCSIPTPPTHHLPIHCSCLIFHFDSFDSLLLLFWFISSLLFCLTFTICYSYRLVMMIHSLGTFTIPRYFIHFGILFGDDLRCYSHSVTDVFIPFCCWHSIFYHSTCCYSPFTTIPIHSTFHSILPLICCWYSFPRSPPVLLFIWLRSYHLFDTIVHYSFIVYSTISVILFVPTTLLHSTIPHIPTIPHCSDLFDGILFNSIILFTLIHSGILFHFPPYISVFWPDDRSGIWWCSVVLHSIRVIPLIPFDDIRHSTIPRWFCSVIIWWRHTIPFCYILITISTFTFVLIHWWSFCLHFICWYDIPDNLIRYILFIWWYSDTFSTTFPDWRATYHSTLIRAFIPIDICCSFWYRDRYSSTYIPICWWYRYICSFHYLVHSVFYISHSILTIVTIVLHITTVFDTRWYHSGITLLMIHSFIVLLHSLPFCSPHHSDTIHFLPVMIPLFILSVMPIPFIPVRPIPLIHFVRDTIHYRYDTFPFVTHLFDSLPTLRYLHSTWPRWLFFLHSSWNSVLTLVIRHSTIRYCWRYSRCSHSVT